MASRPTSILATSGQNTVPAKILATAKINFCNLSMNFGHALPKCWCILATHVFWPRKCPKYHQILDFGHGSNFNFGHAQVGFWPRTFHFGHASVPFWPRIRSILATGPFILAMWFEKCFLLPPGHRYADAHLTNLCGGDQGLRA